MVWQQWQLKRECLVSREVDDITIFCMPSSSLLSWITIFLPFMLSSLRALSAFVVFPLYYHRIRHAFDRTRHFWRPSRKRSQLWTSLQRNVHHGNGKSRLKLNCVVRAIISRSGSQLTRLFLLPICCCCCCFQNQMFDFYDGGEYCNYNRRYNDQRSCIRWLIKLFSLCVRLLRLLRRLGHDISR